jgi:hypothetical protein
VEKMKKFADSKIEFVDEPDGPAERELKDALKHALSPFRTLIRLT